ncbi:hypothetical protein NSIN_20553 [Nitrosotalea sinensis]|uniref:C2H2-type domain-containing protein n=1 Tax=Nitrosotalea sinensis TaxID=1499975 RepID=A0A2H1EG86_9ARCH|nr:hypothetical protein NSIN_20553 [Candidatus Nitrosotalea sinensis]
MIIFQSNPLNQKLFLNKKMPYTCKECKLEFYSREGLEVHVLRKHTTPIPKGLDHFS